MPSWNRGPRGSKAAILVWRSLGSLDPTRRHPVGLELTASTASSASSGLLPVPGAGDDHVVVAADNVEPRELEDKRLVERGLEVEVERLERLVLPEAALVDAPPDTLLRATWALGGASPGATPRAAGRPGVAHERAAPATASAAHWLTEPPSGGSA